MSNLLARVVNPPNTIPPGNDQHPKDKHVAVDGRGFLQLSPETTGYDLAEQVFKVAQMVWDTETLSWVRWSGSPSPGGAAGMANLVRRIDTSNTSAWYIGEAAPGTPAASPAWRIKRVSLSGGQPVDVLLAGGGGFSFSWDGRASHSYL